MNLLELASDDAFTKASIPARTSVPNWMTGAFRRRSISFADGTTDLDTRVYWLQSRGLTIDLRLPRLIDQKRFPIPDPAQVSTLEEFAELEGWYAETIWQNRQLSWREGASLQLHNRWPEPAELRRVGNCMMEFAPSGAYLEDWRYLEQGKDPSGYMIGLELDSETCLNSGARYRRKGALIICGQYAGLVVGRPENTEFSEAGLATATQASDVCRLKERLLCSQSSTEERAWLMDFRCAIGIRQASGDWVVSDALHQAEVGQPLFCLEGFTASEPGYLKQLITVAGSQIERRWRIDTLESGFDYRLSSDVQGNAARDWRQSEAEMLDRYTQWVE